jgi:hypothetical protein
MGSEKRQLELKVVRLVDEVSTLNERASGESVRAKAAAAQRLQTMKMRDLVEEVRLPTMAVAKLAQRWKG